eukprot:1160832-Pelagomonas_calceolata.AAC.5
MKATKVDEKDAALEVEEAYDVEKGVTQKESKDGKEVKDEVGCSRILTRGENSSVYSAVFGKSYTSSGCGTAGCKQTRACITVCMNAVVTCMHAGSIISAS